MRKREPLPKTFASLEKAAEFGDTHSLADYWEYTKPVKFDIQIKDSPQYFKLEESLAGKLVKIAQKKKISAEVLVNLWIQERLSKVA